MTKTEAYDYVDDRIEGLIDETGAIPLFAIEPYNDHLRLIFNDPNIKNEEIEFEEVDEVDEGILESWEVYYDEASYIDF